MELLKAIKERRTIRKFQDREVPKELLSELIRNAMWAPSAMNTQPWKFYVVSGEKKEQLKSIMTEAINHMEERLNKLFKPNVVNMTKSYFTNFGNAPHIIVVTTDILEKDAYQMGAYESVAAAIQNLSLLAHEAGLGTCWMTGILYVEKEILEFLGIDNRKLVAVLTIGYPDQTPPVPPRKDEEIIWVE